MESMTRISEGTNRDKILNNFVSGSGTFSFFNFIRRSYNNAYAISFSSTIRIDEISLNRFASKLTALRYEEEISKITQK